MMSNLSFAPTVPHFINNTYISRTSTGHGRADLLRTTALDSRPRGRM